MFQAHAAKVAGLSTRQGQRPLADARRLLRSAFPLRSSEPVPAGDHAGEGRGPAGEGDLEPGGRVPAGRATGPSASRGSAPGSTRRGCRSACMPRPWAKARRTHWFGREPASRTSSARRRHCREALCDRQPPCRACPRSRSGRHRLLALCRPFDERLLLRDLPRRDGGRRGRIPSNSAVSSWRSAAPSLPA